MDPASLAVFERIVRKREPGATLHRAWTLQGGLSADVTALEIGQHGVRRRIVIRHYGAADLARNPHMAQHEFALLSLLQTVGIPAPRPLWTDESGALLPRPYIVIEFIDGHILHRPGHLMPYLQSMAEVLSTVHRVPFSERTLSFLPRQHQVVGARLAEKPATLDDTLSESRIRAALERCWPPPATNPPALLHGDFWPGNILWRNRRIVGIIDWEDAGYGDPLADLANARLEINMFFGAEALSAFTTYYRQLMPLLNYASLPQWDLAAALRPAGKMSSFGLDTTTLERFRQHHARFVANSLAQLNA